jgi:hypothetical protein
LSAPDVNARATEAGALLEWRALSDPMRAALRVARSVHGGRVSEDAGINGRTVAGLVIRRLFVDRWCRLTARAVYVREVGMADDARRAT